MESLTPTYNYMTSATELASIFIVDILPIDFLINHLVCNNVKKNVLHKFPESKETFF